MEIINYILNSSSIAALIGAFSAFALIILNDWRRNKRKKKILFKEIIRTTQIADKKIESIKRDRESLINDILKPAQIMRFKVEILRIRSTEVMDYIEEDAIAAIDAILYTMESVDNILNDVYETIKNIVTNSNKIKESNVNWKNIILNDYNDSINNLGRLKEMCQNFRNKNYKEIITKQYRAEDYAQ